MRLSRVPVLALAYLGVTLATGPPCAAAVTVSLADLNASPPIPAP